MDFQTIISTIYNFFYGLVHRIDLFDYKVVFSLAFVVVFAWALIILITKSFSYTTRIGNDCDKVTSFLKKHKKVDVNNIEVFNKKCFGKHCVKNLRYRWQLYLKSDSGIPSDFVTNEHCLARKKVGRGISRGRILAFRYGSAAITLAALGYCLHYIDEPAVVTDNPVVIVSGLMLVIGMILICDLLLDTIFSLADNGALKKFYKMTEKLDECVDLSYPDEEEEVEEDYSLVNEENVASSEEVDVVEEIPVEAIVPAAPVEEVKQEEPVYAELTPAKQELPPVEPTPAPAPVEPVAPAPAPVAPVAPTKSAFSDKMDKINALVDRAISAKASRQTYISLAKMLIAAAATAKDENEKAELKKCAAKLRAQIK